MNIIFEHTPAGSILSREDEPKRGGMLEGVCSYVSPTGQISSSGLCKPRTYAPTPGEFGRIGQSDQVGRGPQERSDVGKPDPNGFVTVRL